jgi:choline dehydrogenase-like flavoprotein
MEHPHLESGFTLLSDRSTPVDFYLFPSHKLIKGPVQGVLTLSPEIQRGEKLLNFSAELLLYNTDRAGVAAAHALWRGIRLREIPEGLIKHLAHLIVDLDAVAVAAYRRWVKKFILYVRAEQAPHRDSRLTLSSDRDRLGNNRARLDWRLSAVDRSSMRRAAEILGQELDRAGLGRLRITLDEDGAPWPDSLKGGAHHMGTTRMHTDPAQGLVNADCRVHSVSNLFIAGNSVFPTSGSANPTLTLIALAVRLADHVKKLLQ